MYTPEQLMRLAIAKAQTGIAAGQSPFGCAIAVGEQLLACEHNTVLLSTDPTAHAEVNAIRSACRTAGSIFLAGSVVATTCEPCPMCMAALHWARVDTVYYGASIADAASAGFNELHLSASELLGQGASSVKLIGGLLRDDCRRLFDQWQQSPRRQAY